MHASFAYNQHIAAATYFLPSSDQKSGKRNTSLKKMLYSLRVLGHS